MTFLYVYLAGVAVGLAVMRDRIGPRLATAVLWPLGPLAFALVLSVMLCVATILWPVPMVAFWTVLALLLMTVF